MPYEIKKTGHKFEVINIDTGKTHGRTTKKKAQKQLRLLNAVAHGWKPTHLHKGGFLDDKAMKWISIAGKKNTVNGASIGDALTGAIVHHARENNGANALRKRLEEEEALRKQQEEFDRRRYHEGMAQLREMQANSIIAVHDEKKRLTDQHNNLNTYYENLKKQHLIDAMNAENAGKDEDEIAHKKLYQQVRAEQAEAMAFSTQHTASALARLDEQIHHITNQAYPQLRGAGYEGVTYHLQHIRC